MAEKTELKHITFEGFEFDFDPTVVDDIRFIEYLAEVEDGRPTSYVRVIKLMLGNTYDGLVKHMEKKYGKFTLDKTKTLFDTVTAQLDPKESHSTES